MNTTTGQLYSTEQQIVAAVRRGEPLEVLASDAKDWERQQMERRSEQIQQTREVLAVGKRKKLKL